MPGKERDPGGAQKAKVGVTMNTIFHRAAPLSEKASGKLSKAQRRRGAVSRPSTRVLYAKGWRNLRTHGQMLPL